MFYFAHQIIQLTYQSAEQEFIFGYIARGLGIPLLMIEESRRRKLSHLSWFFGNFHAEELIDYLVSLLHLV